MPQGSGTRSRPQGSTAKRSKTVCYYEVLGVSKGDDLQAIKKAYRSLALRWHPDKNPQTKDEAEVKFKEIAEAYEVLSNGDKRAAYDRWGREGVKKGVGRTPNPDPRPSADPFFDFHSSFHFRSPFDVFRDFFGGRDPFQDLLGEHFHRDFFGCPPEHIDRLFAGPVLRSRGEKVAPYEGGVHGFLSSHFHFDPLQDEDHTKKNGGFSSTISFTSGEPGQAASVRKTSTSTKFVDGKKVITKKTEESGKETVEVVENGKLKSKVVNGVARKVPTIKK